ncbi:ephrin-A1 isoform X1 [Mirounga angustirostris]|uniref:ephrin-A1 isoform X1 n=1 Tax=Mirounga angustirostris TaxID=9716 RepID=UPI00313B8E01
MGAPTKHSFCPVHLATRARAHTHTLHHPRIEEKPARVQCTGSRAGPLASTDEVAMSWAGVRLAWVTQGSGHRRDLQVPGGGGGRLGEKGGAAVSWALASRVLEGHVAHPLRPASSLGLGDRARGKSWHWGLGGHAHWTRFRNEDYTVHVQLNDYLDILCPHYEDDTVADAARERYTLYLVEREEYQRCQPQSEDQARWRCTQPSARHGPEKLSEKFQRFTPFTLGKEFREGHSYYYISKPIHHQEDQCLRLKVTVNGKITHSPQAHANPQEKRLPADDPEVQVLHSIGHSAAPRLFPLAWAVLLLPFLLLQTP